MNFLFPARYDSLTVTDDEYNAEYEAALSNPQHNAVLFDYDKFYYEGRLKIQSNRLAGSYIYRGWMLLPNFYAGLYSRLQGLGIDLINSPEQYNRLHLFPLVYEELKEFTPKILAFPDGEEIDWELVNSTFKRFMMKDYVKSVKESKFPKYFETPVNTTEMDRRINEQS